MIASGISYFNVPEENIVYFDDPSLAVVAPDDCVDFPCDAKRKALILDVDGSVTMNGVASSIIPDNSPIPSAVKMGDGININKFGI